MPKEAHARIKINKLLEAAGWRFFDSSQGKANIALERLCTSISPPLQPTYSQLGGQGQGRD